jgi:hypothetical protein
LQVKSWDELPQSRSRAIVGLKWDTWNDYGFETTFEVRVHWPDRKPIELGIVKILRGDQTGGRTPLKSQFVRLNEDYCSLGQDIAYYEMLHKLGPWGRTYLQHMRDVVGSPIILESFETNRGFKDSLLRSSGAEIALADAPNLFSSVHNESQSIDIDPRRQSICPSQIARRLTHIAQAPRPSSSTHAVFRSMVRAVSSKKHSDDRCVSHAPGWL